MTRFVVVGIPDVISHVLFVFSRYLHEPRYTTRKHCMIIWYHNTEASGGQHYLCDMRDTHVENRLDAIPSSVQRLSCQSDWLVFSIRTFDASSDSQFSVIGNEVKHGLTMFTCVMYFVKDTKPRV